MRERTYNVTLNAISDTFDDVLDDALVIAVGLVITEAHHPPAFLFRVPVHFDDALVKLFAARLHAVSIANQIVSVKLVCMTQYVLSAAH